MTADEARQLKIGDVVRWHDASGPSVEGYDLGTVTAVMPHGIVVAWAEYADSVMPERPLAFEHCGQVSREGSAAEGWVNVGR